MRKLTYLSDKTSLSEKIPDDILRFFKMFDPKHDISNKAIEFQDQNGDMWYYMWLGESKGPLEPFCFGFSANHEPPLDHNIIKSAMLNVWYHHNEECINHIDDEQEMYGTH